MQLLRVRSNEMYRDTFYRKKYPTWDLNKVIAWESRTSLDDCFLVPLPKKQSKCVDA